jgi:hypothetical protein
MRILFRIADSVADKTNQLKMMTIRKILGENGPMSELCNGGTCPAAILTDGDNAYIQGYTLEASEKNEAAPKIRPLIG